MEFLIREAATGDEPEIAGLLALLGYETDPETAASRIEHLGRTGSDPIYLAAVDGRIVGLVALHWSDMLHLDKPAARITGLVVDETMRRAGVGRRLMDHAIEAARRAGCGQVELTTSMRRLEAHAFYEAIGFERTSYKYRLQL